MTSTLSTFPFIQEGSEATPGLWNSVYSILSANINALNSTFTLAPPSGNTLTISSDISVLGTIASSGPVRIGLSSNLTDYLFLSDQSNTRSDYIIGSNVGGTADGLNIWDDSGQTMIVSFSKQSVRFFQNIVGPVFDVGGALADTLNAGTYGNGSDSAESRIQSAINDASIRVISRVYLPASMMSYTPSLVSFIAAVHMVGEGTDWNVYDVRPYGIKGSGLTDEAPAIQALENVRPAYSTVRFTSGKTYLINSGFDGSASQLSKLIYTKQPGVWDLNGSQIRWGSATGMGTGSDGGGLGMINVGAAPWSLLGFGILDGQSLVRSPLCFRDSLSGFVIFCEIKNTRETPSGVWDGTQCTVSVDVTGTSITTRARNISGILRRPSCPMSRDNATIDTHMDLTAFLVGSQNIFNNHTSRPFVISSSGAPSPTQLSAMGLIGVPEFVGNLVNNITHTDLSVCDLNSNALETQGFGTTNWGSIGPGVNLGHAIKNGAASVWYYFGADSSAVTTPNVIIRAGSTVSTGIVYVAGQVSVQDSNSTPGFGWSSETSLGFYRSAASIVALSYGTFSAPYLSTRTILPSSGLTVSLSSALLVVGAGNVNGLLVQHTGSGNHEIRQVSGQLQLINGGVVALTATGSGNDLRIQTNASGTNRMTFRSGGTIDIAQPLLAADGTAIAPAYGFSSDISLGFYRSGASTIAASFGTFNLAKAGVRLSMRTLAASSVTASAAKTNVAVDEVVFTIGGASGASLIIYSGGTAYGFNSAFSAAAA